MDTNQTPTGAEVPAGRRVIAVGDIHGRRDLLAAVLDAARAAARDFVSGERRLTVVFLGDYIDRGPASRGVIEDLIAFERDNVCETIFLRGNHEQALINALDGRGESKGWLEHGGLATLESYGLAWSLQSDERALSASLRQAIAPDHADFLRRTRLCARIGDYIFAHAGLRPGADIADQQPEDLMWSRYLDEPAFVGRITVVHGHTPNPLPVQGPARIAIDTKAYASGSLTMLTLEGATRRFERAVIPKSSATARMEPWRRVDLAYRRTARRGGRWDEEAPAASSGLRRLLAAAIGIAALLASGATALRLQESEARQAATSVHRPG